MNAILRLALGLALALPLAMAAQAQQACQAIAEQARRYTPPADGTFSLDRMSGSIVRLGQRQDPRLSATPSLAQALSARFRLAPELLQAATEFAGPGSDDGVLWQIGQGLHAVEIEGGTAHCSHFLFFAVDPNGRATLVEQPPVIRQARDGSMQRCSAAGSEGLVGTVGGDPAFFLLEGMDQDFEIGVTPWRDRAWQPECKLSLHFSATFRIDQRFCSGVDCEAAANAGLSLAKRFDNNPQLQEQEEARLSPPEREAFRKMKKLAPSTGKELPKFSSKAQFHDFGCRDSDSLLPVKIGSQLYLGRLNHGGIGWRCFDDFVFALYAPKDGGLEPVAGITIGKARAAPIEVSVK